MSAITLLGFDFGCKRVGVATAQTLTHTTRPLTTVAVHQEQPEWSKIQQLISEWQPQQLIVGLPLNEDGSEHRISQLARKFAHQLEKRYQLPVALIDERLTSQEAEAILMQQRKAGKIRRRAAKAAIDQIAAEIILRTWMASTPSTPHQDAKTSR